MYVLNFGSEMKDLKRRSARVRLTNRRRTTYLVEPSIRANTRGLGATKSLFRRKGCQVHNGSNGHNAKSNFWEGCRFIICAFKPISTLHRVMLRMSRRDSCKSPTSKITTAHCVIQVQISEGLKAPFTAKITGTHCTALLVKLLVI